MKLAFWVLLLIVPACARPAVPVTESVAVPGEPVLFAFGTPDGRVVNAENTRGRVTVLLFVTTFDFNSQAAARRLKELLASHVPRFNAVAVVLETAESAVLADVFHKSLSLNYPVTLADSVELRASSAFASIDRVPTLIVLDHRGRIRHKSSGMLETKKLEQVIREAQR